MRFRPLRSRAFWFGVPGLIFLLWAWGLSKTHRSYVMATSDVAELLFGQLDGDVVLIRGSGPVPPLEDWVIVHEELRPGLAAAIKREQRELGDAGIGTVVFVPHGWMVAGYLSAWAGCTAWRRRR
jgi:hypothetical protein